MKINKVSFKNKNNEDLAGRIELPKNRKPHNFVLFAHCFTCNKNFNSVRIIGRALTDAGFGVLRFDFTGLGESKGDFENTNFSGNVDDLVVAASYLKENFMAPTLLIGHSLGGAAAIFAAAQIPSIKAVAVINSPSDPAHVRQLLKSSTSEIMHTGKAVVNLGGSDFTIKKQFLDDLENKPLTEVVNHFKKALLILHTPQDTVVNIKNAEEIFKAARHPKSFVSLDGADHLLSKKEDAAYVGKVISVWASRYLIVSDKEEISSSKEVVASLDSEDNFTTYMKSGDHYFVADEPISFGGNNFGPSPYQYVSAALAACTAMTIQMYARRKEWKVENVTVRVNHSRDHAADCKNCDDESPKIDILTREISFDGSLSVDKKNRLLEIADRCPVHRTLQGKIQIITSLVK